ncbi:MAG: hypothetical protein HYY04_18745 [Chloroflexi bacterium]|nr:hypothetical protein [Chloroflexota bacterium]
MDITVVIALASFVGLVLSWIVLPGGASAPAAEPQPMTLREARTSSADA